MNDIVNITLAHDRDGTLVDGQDLYGIALAAGV